MSGAATVVLELDLGKARRPAAHAAAGRAAPDAEPRGHRAATEHPAAAVGLVAAAQRDDVGERRDACVAAARP